MIVTGKGMTRVGELLPVQNNVNPEPGLRGCRIPLLPTAKKGQGDAIRISLGKGDVELTNKMSAVRHRSPALCTPVAQGKCRHHPGLTAGGGGVWFPGALKTTEISFLTTAPLWGCSAPPREHSAFLFFRVQFLLATMLANRVSLRLMF